MLQTQPTGLDDAWLVYPDQPAPQWPEEANLLIEFGAALGKRVRLTHAYRTTAPRHTLRGIHYHVPPSVHATLVRVHAGEAYVVAVDIRKTSATFGQWYGTTLSSKGQHMLWLPVGMAYGYLVQSPQATLVLHTTSAVTEKNVRRIAYNDAELCIRWPLVAPPAMLDADKRASPFSWWNSPKDSTFGVSVLDEGD